MGPAQKLAQPGEVLGRIPELACLIDLYCSNTWFWEVAEPSVCERPLASWRCMMCCKSAIVISLQRIARGCWRRVAGKAGK